MGLVFNATDSADLAVDPIAVECLSLISPVGQGPGGGDVALADVAPRPLILPGHPHGLRAEVERAFAALGLAPDVALEIDALDHIVTLVARGRGHAILSPRVACAALSAGRIVATPITGPAITRTIGLARSRLRPPSIALRHALPALVPLIRRLVRGAVAGVDDRPAC
jgi:LysR family nitrogen assimilation transcriptional regulator